MISVHDALSCILEISKLQNRIQKNLAESFGYVLAEDVFADRDYPPFNRAAVDGYAVNYEEIKKGKITFPVSQVIHAGQANDEPCKQDHCIKIMTGASVPENATALFKVEDCKVNGDTVELPVSTAREWLNIDRKGQVYKERELILKAGNLVDISTVNALASVGKNQLNVYQKLSISIISTGNEIVDVDTQPLHYQIRDSNYYALLYGLRNLGISVFSHERADDDLSELTRAVESGLKSDVLLITGGVSMGDADFIPKILQECAVEQIFHKVKMKPGKPLWFGKTKENKNGKSTTVFGIPGNPYSVMVTFKVFIEPFLRKSYGAKPQASLKLPLIEERQKRGDRPEYFLVKMVNTKEGTALEPVSHKGSGDINAGVSTDGIAFHPQAQQKVKAGEVVEFIPWR